MCLQGVTEVYKRSEAEALLRFFYAQKQTVTTAGLIHLLYYKTLSDKVKMCIFTRLYNLRKEKKWNT